MKLAKLSIFSNRHKTKIALGQLALVIIVLILSVVRMLTRPAAAPRNRASTMSLGMAAKSLILLLYELLTEHVNAFKRWASYKAYFIINALEVVFWGAVVFLIIQSSLDFCEGINCTLGWVVMVLGIILNIVANHVAVICFLDWRYHKRTGNHRPAVYSAQDYEMKNGTSASTHRRRVSSNSQNWPQPSAGVTSNPSVMEQGFAGQQKSARYVQTREVSPNSQSGHYHAQPATFNSQATSDSRGRYGNVQNATAGQVHSNGRTHSRTSSHGNNQQQHSSRSRRNSGSHGQGRTSSRVRESSVVRHQNLQQIRGGSDYQAQQHQQSVPPAQAQSPWTPLSSEQYHGEVPTAPASPYDAPPVYHSQTGR